MPITASAVTRASCHSSVGGSQEWAPMSVGCLQDQEQRFMASCGVLHAHSLHHGSKMCIVSIMLIFGPGCPQEAEPGDKSIFRSR